MPFPINLESLLAAGYVFLRSETCPACREPVEVFTTPGKREIALNPMCELLRPAVRHYETCNIAPKQEAANGSTGNDVQDAQGRDSDGGPTAISAPAVGRGHAPRAYRWRTRCSRRGNQALRSHRPNKQLIAVGWDDGVLVCQFKTAKWSYAGVPEAEFVKLRRVPTPIASLPPTSRGNIPQPKWSRHGIPSNTERYDPLWVPVRQSRRMPGMRQRY